MNSTIYFYIDEFVVLGAQLSTVVTNNSILLILIEELLVLLRSENRA